jgi:hypothetical protein
MGDELSDPEIASFVGPKIGRAASFRVMPPSYSSFDTRVSSLLADRVSSHSNSTTMRLSTAQRCPLIVLMDIQSIIRPLRLEDISFLLKSNRYTRAERVAVHGLGEFRRNLETSILLWISY